MSEKNGERLDTDDKAPLGRLQTGTSGGVNGADAQTGQTGGGGLTPGHHHPEGGLAQGPGLERDSPGRGIVIGRWNSDLVTQPGDLP